MASTTRPTIRPSTPLTAPRAYKHVGAPIPFKPLSTANRWRSMLPSLLLRPHNLAQNHHFNTKTVIPRLKTSSVANHPRFTLPCLLLRPRCLRRGIAFHTPLILTPAFRFAFAVAAAATTFISLGSRHEQCGIQNRPSIQMEHYICCVADLPIEYASAIPSNLGCCS